MPASSKRLREVIRPNTVNRRDYLVFDPGDPASPFACRTAAKAHAVTSVEDSFLEQLKVRVAEAIKEVAASAEAERAAVHEGSSHVPGQLPVSSSWSSKATSALDSIDAIEAVKIRVLELELRNIDAALQLKWTKWGATATAKAARLQHTGALPGWSVLTPFVHGNESMRLHLRRISSESSVALGESPGTTTAATQDAAAVLSPPVCASIQNTYAALSPGMHRILSLLTV